MPRSAIYGALVLLLGLAGAVSFLTNPLPRPASAAQKAASVPVYERMTPAQIKAEMERRKRNDMYHEKIAYQQAKRKVWDPQAKMMIPSADYTEGDWFRKRRDGSAGLKELAQQATRYGN